MSQKFCLMKIEKKKKLKFCVKKKVIEEKINKISLAILY